MLRDKLVCGGEEHTQFGFCGEQVEDDTVVIQIRNGRITPGITFPLPLIKA